MAQNIPQNNCASGLDWFRPAIETDGSVDACLAAVASRLNKQNRFIAMLRKNLDGASGRDGITELGKDVKRLTATLDARLGILRPERISAWFRTPAATSSGPFTSTLIQEPVFTRYEASEVGRIKKKLASSWEKASVKESPLVEGPCLWHTLLGYKARFAQINRLADPFPDRSLLELVGDLPSELESPSLRAFLSNVATELQSTLSQLEDCHRRLLEASETFWLKYAEGDLSRYRALHNEQAERVRDSFRRRRTQHFYDAGPKRSSPQDLRALQTMGFNGLPTFSDLRRRYLSLAKKLHPDTTGGDAERFKNLTSAYRRLVQRIGSRTS